MCLEFQNFHNLIIQFAMKRSHHYFQQQDIIDEELREIKAHHKAKWIHHCKIMEVHVELLRKVICQPAVATGHKYTQTYDDEGIFWAMNDTELLYFDMIDEINKILL